MPNNNDDTQSKEPILSEQDERLLKYLAFIAGAMKQPDKEAPSRKTFWTAFREPAVVATLITVLIGGIAATLITSIIQSRAKDREFQQGLMKSQADQELVRYTKYLDQEQALISRVYSLIGVCTSGAYRNIGLTAEYPPTGQQARDIVRNYNVAKAKWASERLELAQLMGYYHPKDTTKATADESEVVTAWKRVPDALDAYVICADDWYYKYKGPAPQPTPPSDTDLNNACKQKYDALIANLNTLTEKLSLSQPQPQKSPQTQSSPSP